MVALYMEPEEESAVIKVRIPVYSAPDFLFLDYLEQPLNVLYW